MKEKAANSRDQKSAIEKPTEQTNIKEAERRNKEIKQMQVTARFVSRSGKIWKFARQVEKLQFD